MGTLKRVRRHLSSWGVQPARWLTNIGRGSPLRRLTLLLAACIVLPACSPAQVEVFPSPDVSLAARPSETLASPARTPKSTKGSEVATPPSAEASDPSAAPAATDEPVAKPPVDPPVTQAPPVSTPLFRPIGGINDPQGDIASSTPPWADIIGLVLDDDGATFRIAVDLAHEVPAVLRNNETARVGVDFFRGDGGETRYRVFVDGDRDGWLAYFQRPDGFVDNPGTLTLTGTRIILTLPAELLGDPVRGEWRAFVQWTGPGNGRESIDHAPDESWSTFAR